MKPRTLITLTPALLVLSMASGAAEVSVANLNWSTTGVAGLIAGDYQASPDDIMLGASPVGNASFGYLSTSGGLYGVSPLALNLDEFGFDQTNGSRVVSSHFTAQANDTLMLHFNYVTTDGRGYDDYAWARLVSSTNDETVAWLFTARSGNAPDGDGTGDYVPGKVLSEQVNYKDLDSDDPNRKIAAVLNGGVPVIGMPGGSGTNWVPLGLTNTGSYGWCWDVGSGCGSSGWIESAYSVENTGSYYLEFGVINWGDEFYDSALAVDFAGLSQNEFGNALPLANAAPVPEPAQMMLLPAGLVMVAWVVGRRRQRYVI